MKISELGVALKVELVSGGKRTLCIGDYVEVVYKVSALDDVEEVRGCAGLITRIDRNSIRITNYNGFDENIALESITELIDE